ncbi:MAG: hypothetical protein IT330_06360 [Anaerolineae bacterium]|nr:hypothetical protein [Anaerolineae bacterium]
MKRFLFQVLLAATLLAPPGVAQRGPVAQAAPPAQPRYTITDLGTLSGASEAFAISNNGKVAGLYMAGNYAQAFLWEDGVMQGLGTLGGSSSEAHGVNDAGQVVGYSLTGSGRIHAFLWQNGAMQDLGTFGGGSVSLAFGINNSGQVVGHSDNGAYQLRAFRWSGGMADLGVLSNGEASWGYGINDNGQAVGASRISVYPDSTTHAFRWSGGMQDLGTLGWKHSIARGINDNGQVVGHLADASSTAWNAFLWNGGMQNLGGTQSSAADINNDGLIVGESGGQAVLWENGQMKNLNSLIDANSGWVLLSARAINEKGQIVGKGSFNGQTRAFLLSPRAYYWINPSGGSWHVTTNWDPQGDPGDGDTVIFALSGQYAVDARAVAAAAAPAANFPVGRMIISGTNTVDFQNLALNLLDDSVTEPALTVNEGGTVKITSGTGNLIHAIIGGAPPANPANAPTAHLQVFNNGTSLNGTGRLTIGDKGAGDLFVANGHLTSAESRLGGALPGTAVVGGDGSLWQTGNIAVGYGVSGTLTIERGGRVDSDDAFVGYGVVSDGSYVLIDGVAAGGQPSLWGVQGNLTVEERGWVDVQDGAQLAANQNIYLKGGALNLYNRAGSQVATHLEVLGDLIVGGGNTGGSSAFGVYLSGAVSPSHDTQAHVGGNLLVGRDGEGVVVVAGDPTMRTSAALLVTDPGKGLCQIGDAYDGWMSISGYMNCRTVAIGGQQVIGGLGHVTLTGLLLAHEVVRVGQVGGGAPAMVDMAPGFFAAELTGIQGVYIGPTGVVSGTGIIDAGGIGLLNEGVILPGIRVIQAAQAQMVGEAQASPATLTISGTLTISPTGRLEIPVTGASPGLYGSLAGTGTVTLDGVLALKFRNGYAPRQGDTFTFLKATRGISGTFDSVVISGLAPGFAYELTSVNGQAVLKALNNGVPLGRAFLPLVVR